MELTGKCKEDFEEWFIERFWTGDWAMSDAEKMGLFRVKKFYLLPPSMKYGVYVDFFDSVDISMKCKDVIFEIYSENTNRYEARTKAVEKANEIYNETHVKKS